jgi:hypothetical protein
MITFVYWHAQTTRHDPVTRYYGFEIGKFRMPIWPGSVVHTNIQDAASRPVFPKLEKN